MIALMTGWADGDARQYLPTTGSGRFLGRMIDNMDFEIVCANPMVSDTYHLPPVPPHHTVLGEQRINIGFISVVTNY